MRLTLSLILIVIALLSSGCRHAEFVDVPLFVTDLDNSVCAEYKYINRETLQVQHVKDHELYRCNGLVGYQPKDYTNKVKRWIVDVIKEVKNYLNTRLK